MCRLCSLIGGNDIFYGNHSFYGEMGGLGMSLNYRIETYVSVFAYYGTYGACMVY